MFRKTGRKYDVKVWDALAQNRVLPCKVPYVDRRHSKCDKQELDFGFPIISMVSVEILRCRHGDLALLFQAEMATASYAYDTHRILAAIVLLILTAVKHSNH